MPQETGRPFLFCFGLGYSASTLGRKLLNEGWRVVGTVRAVDKGRALAAEGFEVHVFEGAKPMANAGKILAGATHILSSVPPDADGDPVLRHHCDDIAASPSAAWIGYLSTTGVYGDRSGDWVDESATLEPTGPRGARRVAAEAEWLDLWWEHGLPVHLFRLAGIYGPGRSALDTVRSGRVKRIHKAGQVFSRIHVEDIVQVLRASMAKPNPGAAYNVCDDNPAPPDEVIDYACRLLGVTPPPLVPYHEAEAGMSDMARSFYRDNKRVRNDRIKSELGVRLAYPDYRTGLEELLRRSQAES